MEMQVCRMRSVIAVLPVVMLVGTAAAQEREFVPEVGQPGKDVVWVPTPEPMVEKMLDLAKVTPQDFVIDLGSGDGRNVIAAAKRGARGLGVEYNPDMVNLSKRLAEKAGVADRVQFVQGDMFEADISKATVLALFLLPSNLARLKDKFLALPPGTRLVMNTFGIQDWTPDETETLPDCTSWCTAMLYIVPARVAGTWRLPQGGELTLTQQYQMVTGTGKTADGQALEFTGRLRGADITLTAEGRELKGRVNGDTIEATMTVNGKPSAVRLTRVN